MQLQDDRDDGADRPLWDMLQSAPKPRVSTRFADDVLRRIRLEEEASNGDGFRLWLRQSWKMMTGLSLGAAGVALLTTGVFLQPMVPGPRTEMVAGLNESPDFSALIASVPENGLAVLGDLDTTIDDNDIWLASDSY